MVSCLDYLDKLELLLSVIGLARREIKAFCANFSHDQDFNNSNPVASATLQDGRVPSL